MASALIGRGRELFDLRERARDHRLVTVVGPGGVGKTALARAAAELLAEGFSVAPRFVDLTRVDDSAAVPAALAAQLGFDSFDALLSSPSDRPVVWVVDNCEHLLDGTAAALAQVLGARGQPTIIATSRSPLDVPGESVLVLAPLALPAPGDDPREISSVALFLQRCRDVGVEIGDSGIETVAELCRRLDGLPLALEIAAARTRTMTVAELAAQLEQSPEVLERPRFRGDARHRSLTSTIGWSYDLLPTGSARLFEQLGVFAGSFTAADARAVAIDSRDFDVQLDDLVHASLVAADTSATETRYRLLDTVRRFALDRLAVRGGVDDTYDRFVDHVLALL